MNQYQNTITPFLFGESTVRTTLHQAAPWFVLSDVCKVLEIANPHNVPKRLHPDDLHTMEVIDSLGRTQTANICNESGLYTLIFQSRKAAAKEFTRWVTSEVLPSIRRTGCFHRGHQAFLYLIQDQLALGVSVDLAARLAGKLTGIPKEEYLGHKVHPQQEVDIDSITSLMQPGITYSIEAIATLLPPGHHLARGTKKARESTVGKILTKADHLARVEKIPGRNVRYRLPAIAQFPGTSNG